jgi:hypothetical protein
MRLVTQLRCVILHSLRCVKFACVDVPLIVPDNDVMNEQHASSIYDLPSPGQCIIMIDAILDMIFSFSTSRTIIIKDMPSRAPHCRLLLSCHIQTGAPPTAVPD